LRVGRRKRRFDIIKGLGPKYGATLRKRWGRVVALLRARRRCPSCGSLAFKREAVGIWACLSCGYKMAGGAYTPHPTRRGG
jgi:large subunit ribosomal protein L37Ae